MSRALQSDHRRSKADDQTAAELCFGGIFLLIVVGAILKAFGIL